MGLAPSRDPELLAALVAVVRRIGRESIAPHAAAVDKDARFPAEAFAALREARLLSCYVPTEHGGMGLTIAELCRICEVLGTFCGSTAMIFAMHQIQVACIVHHAMSSEYFRRYIGELVTEQRLLASATTELGIGGDVRTSQCAVMLDGERFTLTKKAPVISYGEHADAILVTARRSPEAGPSDQVHVLVRREDCTLEPLSGWDTLGFRGTCSLGFTLTAEGSRSQILPVPYADIHNKTMHPFSHSVWSALWLGIAADAVQRARGTVRAQARKTPGTLPPSAMRLAEVDTVLFSMRSIIGQTVGRYHDRLIASGEAPFSSDFDFTIQVNNLKVKSSQLVVDIVSRSMMICGIQGYRNDSRFSLGRHLRDAYGAALMVNNDRILGQSATMQIVRRGS
ncbi:MAG: acyl-CoA dehydrogenase [Myxococcota bacterium]|jgi:acyl-CoA dehydrogenase